MNKGISFIDTTLRDGSQSNWAAGMPVGMMDAVIGDCDKVGYSSIDAPIMPILFKKIIRDLKEDPWEMIRMLGRKAPNTIKSGMVAPSLRAFDSNADNREAVKLYFQLMIDMGAIQRVQIASNVVNASLSECRWFIPFLKERGIKIAYAVCYYISPRHTDEFYVRKTKEAVAMGADAIYLKDAGGLLTTDTVKRVFPLIKEHANGIPLEIHSHCTTGLADPVYALALKLGCSGFHVATPPLAEGTAQPSVFNTADNFKTLGYDPGIDIELVESISRRLYMMAEEAGLPAFGPTRYKVSQYIHRIPGGVLSNLKHQLKSLHLEDRLDEVMAECVTICAEMGEPHMITPYSQFVCSQAAINVAMGERYKIVIDDFIRFSLGCYGEDSGYIQMDQGLKDRFINMPRAKIIQESIARRDEELNRPLKDIRDQYGSNISDEEFILRYIMKGTDEIEAMRIATKDHPFRQFACLSAGTPILDLIKELDKYPKITQIQVQHENKQLVLKR